MLKIRYLGIVPMLVFLTACGNPTPTVAPTLLSTSNVTATLVSVTVPPTTSSAIISPTVERPISLVYSPNNEMVAATTRRGIVLYDGKNGAPIRNIDEGEYTESAAFSLDSARLACICGEGLIKIWDVESGQLLKTLKDEKFFTSVAFSPNGQYLAGGTFNGNVKVWDANGETLRFTLTVPTNGEIYPLVFNPDSKHILSVSSLSGSIRVWDANTGTLLYAFPDYSNFMGIEFSPDGMRVATGNMSGDTIRVWDVNNGKLLTTLTTSSIVRFAFTSDSKAIACICKTESGILIWDTNNGKSLPKLADDIPNIFLIAFSTDGMQLAVSTREGQVHILNLRP